MVVAGIGILINRLTALLFDGPEGRHQIKGAFLHMAADAAISLGVVIAAGHSAPAGSGSTRW